MNRKLWLIVSISVALFLGLAGTAGAVVAPPDYDWLIGDWEGVYSGTWGGSDTSGDWSFSVDADGNAAFGIDDVGGFGLSGTGTFDFDTGEMSVSLGEGVSATATIDTDGSFVGEISVWGAAAIGMFYESDCGRGKFYGSWLVTGSGNGVCRGYKLNTDSAGTRDNALVVDFGANGVSTYDTANGWARKTSADADLILALDVDADGEEELAMTFGSSLFVLDGTTWTRIATTTVQQMLAVGNALVADFGTSGVSSYTTSSGWVRITSADPVSMTVADIDEDGGPDLVMTFSDGSLFVRYATGSWSKIGTGAGSVVPFEN